VLPEQARRRPFESPAEHGPSTPPPSLCARTSQAESWCRSGNVKKEMEKEKIIEQCVSSLAMPFSNDVAKSSK